MVDADFGSTAREGYMRMLRVTLGLLVAAICAVTGTAAPTQAATVDECQVLLSHLQQDTLDAFAETATVDRLVVKLDDTSTKLAEGKYADAVAKLTGYQTTLTQLAGAPKAKVDPTAAGPLNAEAQGVIDCILTLG
jgi:hypothetical protein